MPCEELAQLDIRLLGVVGARRSAARGSFASPSFKARCASFSVDDRVDQPLLGAVVQIPNHPTALLVGSPPRSASADAATSVRASAVRDRGRHQLGELGGCGIPCREANGVALLDEAAMTPHRRPSTTIGQPTDERIPKPLRFPARDRALSAGEAVHPSGGGWPSADECGDARAFQREPLADGQSRGPSPRLQPATKITLSPDS